MDMITRMVEVYGRGEDDQTVNQAVATLLSNQKAKYRTTDQLKQMLGCIDLTSLNTQDDVSRAHQMADKVNGFASTFPSLPNVAAICVYPALVEELHARLPKGEIKLAAVGAGFPSSQTFMAVKLAECELLVSKGADEVDVVLSVGTLLSGDYEEVLNELILIREVTQKVHLKVILETGLLKTSENIRSASLIAMEAGADFIKTSTGKVDVGATPEAVYVMAKAIRDYHQQSGRRVGLKPSGGIATVEDALDYLTLVSELLGADWISPSYFRFGASRLANNLLSEILQKEVKYF